MRCLAAEADGTVGREAIAVTESGSLLRKFVENGDDVAQQTALVGSEFGQALREPGIARAGLGLEQLVPRVGDRDDRLPLVGRMLLAPHEAALLEIREHLRHRRRLDLL